jgi:hypothetical protein
MATLTPTALTFNTAVAKPAAAAFSASDTIDTSGMKTEDLLIEINSVASSGEKSLELTFKKGIGTNAVVDKTITVEPEAKVMISGAESARFVDKDGKIAVTGVLSSGGSGGTLADYEVHIYNTKP